MQVKGQLKSSPVESRRVDACLLQSTVSECGGGGAEYVCIWNFLLQLKSF